MRNKSKKNNPLLGIKYFIEGIKLCTSQGFRRFIIIPIFINTIIFISTIYFSFNKLNSYAPENSTLSFLFWLFFIIVSLIFVITLFVTLSNLIASPFYGFLSEKILKKYNKINNNQNTNIIKITISSIKREIIKLLYFIPLLILNLIIFIIPVLNIITPITWFLTMIWILAIQFIDYAADNSNICFKDSIKIIKKYKLLTLVFGACVSFTITIPILNFFIPAAAVAGGTLLYIDLRDNFSSIN